jgi:hypothetical protein
MGLAALVQTRLEADPFSDHIFTFRGRRGDRIKLPWWDGEGLCLFAKRLERDRFVWPQATSGTVALTPAQLSMRLEGGHRLAPAAPHGSDPGGMTDPAALPDELPALKALIEAQRVEIACLKLLIAKLRRPQFGRRSEPRAGLLTKQPPAKSRWVWVTD